MNAILFSINCEKKIGYILPFQVEKPQVFFSILVKLRHFSGFKLIWHNIEVKFLNVI